MGIMIISYTIKEVNDDVDYLKSLGMARTAEVQRDARIGEAQARMQVSRQLFDYNYSTNLYTNLLLSFSIIIFLFVNSQASLKPKPQKKQRNLD